MNNRSMLFALPLMLILVGGRLIASEEEFLEYSEIRIVGPERKDTGKVVFAAKADEEKILAVNIEAFGKKYELSKVELEKIAGFPLSSLVITHEAGNDRTGGHLVHFKLKQIRYQDKQLTEEKALISVSKENGLNVRRMEPQPVHQSPAK